MIRRFLFRVCGDRPCRLISILDEPYLERYYVGRILGVQFYLHRFVSADGDREVHDHPWRWSAALVLAGGYVEERMRWLDMDMGWQSYFRRLFPGCLNRFSPRTFHQIVTVKPETWTLFMHGHRVKKWGFLRRDESGVRYHQPHTVGTDDWWRRAPLGRETNRQPMPGPA